MLLYYNQKVFITPREYPSIGSVPTLHKFNHFVRTVNGKKTFIHSLQRTSIDSAVKFLTRDKVFLSKNQIKAAFLTISEEFNYAIVTHLFEWSEEKNEYLYRMDILDWPDDLVTMYTEDDAVILYSRSLHLLNVPVDDVIKYLSRHFTLKPALVESLSKEDFIKRLSKT